MLHELPHVTCTGEELIKVNEPKEDTYEVREIIDHKTVNKKRFYKVWWRGYLKRDSAWELESDLIQDGLSDYIEFYENKRKK